MAFQAGTAFVPVVPSLRDFQRDIARAVNGAGRDAGRTFGREFGAEATDESRRSLRDGIGGLENGLGRIGARVGRSIGVALSGALVKAAVPAAAAGIAALPAAMAATLVAAKTLQVGLIGVGEAMSAVAEGDAKKLDEALEKLSPNARAFVRQAALMRGEIVGLQRAVQDRLFRGLDQDLKTLGNTYLPVARRGMVGVAGALNGIGREAVKTANTPWFRGQVGQVFQGTTGIVRTLQGAVRPLLESVLRLTVAGMPLAHRFAEWAVQGIRAAAAWLELKTESGQLQATITRIGDAFAQFGRIGANIGSTIANLTRQTDQFGVSGTSLLTTIEQLTARMAAWSASAQGQESSAAVWQTLGTAAQQLATVLPLLLSPLKLIAQALAGMPEPLRNVVGQMLGWVVIIGLVASRLRALTVVVTAGSAAAKAATVAFTGLRAAFGAAGIAGFIAGLRNVNAAMAANATVATRLGAALRAQVLLWRQQAAAAGVSTARIIANAAAQRVAAAATRVWAAAQALFNAVLSANPIALIVIAIAALVAAVVIAYKRSETFRTIVQSVWTAVKNAIATAWAFIKPIFMQFVNVLTNVIGTALRWYWAYVRFVFTTVWTIIQTTWNFIRPIFMAIVGVIRGVLGAAWVFLQNLIKVVWIAIQVQIRVAWAVIKGIFNAIRAFVSSVLAPVFRWLWRNVIVPAWQGIQIAIRGAWTIIRGIFNAVRSFINGVLAPVFRWLWRNVMVPVWNGIRATISGVWNNGIRPAFDALKRGVQAVRNAFSTAVDAIKRVWDKLKGIAKTPVNFVIGLYNNGLVKLVNGIAKLAGIDTRLGTIPKFKTGGIMPGYRPGVDSLIAAVSPGESIFRPEFTRAVGSSWVQTANTIARRSGPQGVRQWMAGGGLGFNRGGVVPGYAGHFDLGGIVGGFLGKAKDFALGNAADAARGILEKVLGAVVPGKGMFRDVIAAIPRWIKNNILGFIGNLIEKIGGDGKKVVSVAEKYVGMSGNPNKWTRRMGMNGLPWCAMFVDGVFDEAGASKALAPVTGGRAAVWSYRALPSVSPANKRPGDLALYRGDTGHINIYTGKGLVTIGGNESNSVRKQSGYISSASSIRRPKFARGGIVQRILNQDRDTNRRSTTPLATQAMRAITGQKIYDDGGLLHRGLTLAYHAGTRPDRVLTDAQWGAVYSAASASAQPRGPVMAVQNQYINDGVDLDLMTQRLEFASRSASF